MYKISDNNMLSNRQKLAKIQKTDDFIQSYANKYLEFLKNRKNNLRDFKAEGKASDFKDVKKWNADKKYLEDNIGVFSSYLGGIGIDHLKPYMGIEDFFATMRDIMAFPLNGGTGGKVGLYFNGYGLSVGDIKTLFESIIEKSVAEKDEAEQRKKSMTGLIADFIGIPIRIKAKVSPGVPITDEFKRVSNIGMSILATIGLLGSLSSIIGLTIMLLEKCL